MEYKQHIYDKNNRINRDKLADLFRNYCKSWMIPALEENSHKNVILSYAEHPYVSSRFKGYEIDVVFAFLLNKEFLFENGPITAVDRTYYHSQFVNNNLNAEQHDDVRLLKKLFKNQFSYGDKAPIGRGGFIGYAAELMVHQFGNMEAIFKNFHDLPNIAVDVYNRDEHQLRQRMRLQNDFLIVMDPTDKERNVAASISSRSWIYCREVIKKFIENPSADYFLERTIPLIDKESQDANNHYVLAHFMQQTDDHYTKIRDKLYSMADTISDIAANELDGTPRFQNVNYAIYFNPPSRDFFLSFYTTEMNISQEYSRRGPPLKDMRNLKKFARKHPNYTERDGYAWIPKKRKYHDFLNFIRTQIEKNTFSEIKTEKISKIGAAEDDRAILCASILRTCIIPYQEELSRWTKRKLHQKNKKYRR